MRRGGGYSTCAEVENDRSNKPADGALFLDRAGVCQEPQQYWGTGPKPSRSAKLSASMAAKLVRPGPEIPTERNSLRASGFTRLTQRDRRVPRHFGLGHDDVRFRLR